jgi:RHS repeat-associated protein
MTVIFSTHTVTTRPTYSKLSILASERLRQRIQAGNPTVSFKYKYDDVGNLTRADELIDNTLPPQATTIYKYDDPRYLNTEIIQTGVGLVNKDVKFTYDPTTGVNTTIERYVDGLLKVKTTNGYDGFGRLTGITQTNGAAVTIGTSSYIIDDLDRLKTETVDGQIRTIGYDSIDQVKTVTGSNNEAYTYDLNGNRINPGYETGLDNRLHSDGTYDYQYDAEGNRTHRTETATGIVDRYTWDYRNRLMSIVTVASGDAVLQTVEYEYDVDDQRVRKTVTSALPTGGVVENYFIDRDQIAFVTDGSGDRTFHYLYGLNVDSVLAQDSSTGMLWALADRLGSIDTLTDEDGVVVDKRSFDSFGRVLSESNPSVSFRYGYTARELDLESGLAYYRARYYDPNVGRFISVDPLGFEAGDTNLYRYVSNNSTNYTDPTGMWWQLPLVGAAIGALANIIHQGLEIAEGSRRLDQFSVGQVTVSAIAGAAIAPAAAIAAVQFPSIFLATNLVLNAKGASDAVHDMGNKKPLSGAFDLVTSLLPFTTLPPGGNAPKSAGMGQLAMATANAIDGSISNGARELNKLGDQLGQAWMAMTDNSEDTENNTNSGSNSNNSGKPSHSPDPKKWRKKGGTIDEDWTYTDWEGNKVYYKDGYPDYESSGYVRAQVEIQQKGNHTTDYTDATKANGGVQPEGTTWHHHQNGTTMQAVDIEIHRRFTHRGGVSVKKKGN